MAGLRAILFATALLAGCDAPADRNAGLQLPDSSVVWVIRARDALTCTNAAAALRRILAANPELELVTVAVDDPQGLVAGLLRAERLPLHVRSIGSEGAARAAFRVDTLPALLRIEGGVVQWRLTARAATDPSLIARTLGAAEL